ncbi:MAG: HlyC/CorC family transporter, partial [Deltaproteobacteria bacterium]|nr:HlyC/CorC family transporter [Deltaproteobacteria bacterium]
SAFFSGSETALLRLRDEQVERDVREARGPAVLAVQSLLRSTSRLLVTILLGNNVVNILAASVASAMAVYYLGEQMGIIVATISLTVVILIFCEVLPKALAAHNPRRFSRLVALPLYLLHQGLRPVHALFDRFVEPFVEAVAGGSVGEEEGAASGQDLLTLALAAGRGQPEGSPLAIIGAAADAEDTTVGQIMVPRAEIVAFPHDTPPTELLERMLGDRYTRVPIYRDSIDTILGKIHLKDLVRLVREGRDDLHSVLRPVLRVPPRKPILSLLSDMQRAFAHVAVVKDEFGVTQGLVTQEDILEELVGEIRDEFDREELLTIRRQDDGSYEVLGRVKVADFNRETGLEIPAEPGDTLSGLVFNIVGRPPRQAETVQVGDYTLSVLDVSGTRITQVGVTRASSKSS